MPTNGSPIYTPPPGSGGGGGASPSPATSVTASDVGDAGVVGSSTRYAREDHEHAREAFGSPATLNADGTAADGTAVSVARSDHKHGIPSTLNANARVAVSRSGALVGTRRGINFANNTGITWTVADNAGSERVDITPTLTSSKLLTHRTGSLLISGHSWTAGGHNYQTYGLPQYNRDGFAAHLAGMLNVHNDNITHLGQSGAALACPVNQFFFGQLNGWAGIYQLSTPGNSTLFQQGGSRIRPDVLAPVPMTNVLFHGINDYSPSLPNQSFPAHIQNAFKNSLRAAISRMRAGALYCAVMSSGTMTWDSAITFSGGWTNVANGYQNTGAGYATTAANGNTITFTIPNGYVGGTICFSFIGQASATDLVTTGGVTAGATTVNLFDGNEFNATGNTISYPCSIMVGTDSVIATAYNSGTKVLTLSAGIPNSWPVATVVKFDQTRQGVTWSTNRVGDTIVSSLAKTTTAGQGNRGHASPVVQRITGLDASYAGKTITATTTGFRGGADTSVLAFDSVWIEADSSVSNHAPPVLVGNIPKMGYKYPYITSYANFNTMNTDITNVVAEFDSSVALVDVHSKLTDRDAVFSSAVTTVGVAGDSISLSVTANSTSFNTTGGYLMAAAGEIFLVNSVTGSYPNYTLACTRSPSGWTSQSANITHAVNDPIHRFDNMSIDHVHQSQRGAAMMARAYVDALESMTLSDAASNLSTSSVTQETMRPSLGIGSDQWLQPPMGGTTTLALVQDKAYANPVFIPKESIIVGAGVVAGAASTGTLRLGLWDCDSQRSMPGYLLCDFGTVSPVTSNTFYQTTSGTVYYRVKPGWYYVGCQRTNASGVTLRAIGGANNAPGYQLPLNTTPSGTTSHYTGYIQNGTITTPGALDSFFYTPIPSTSSPVVWLQIRTVGY